MIETMNIAIGQFSQYMGNRGLYALFLAALLYLCLEHGNEKKGRIFVQFSILYAIVYLCPISAKIIMNKMIGQTTYWRMLWILPVTIVIGYAGVQLIERYERGKKQAGVLALVCLVIALSGSNMLTQGTYSRSENTYKLSQSVIDAADIVEADAAQQGITTIKAIVSNDMVCYIRQYDANIGMPYGRDGFAHKGMSDNEAAIFDTMNAETIDWNTIGNLADAESCNYLICYLNEADYQPIIDAGYEPVDTTATHYIFRRI